MPWRALDVHNEGGGLEMEPWRVYRPVVVDSHHFDEKQGSRSGFALK